MPQLQLDVTADATQAAASLDSVGAAARDMATDVDTAAAAAGQGAASMDVLAGAGDNAASKASQATGAFGALAGGLEAAGFEGAATGLQGVAVATDFASGAGDLLNLVMETQAVRFVVAKVAMVGSAVATGAQTVATTAATAAQWLWNAALTANPIGLVVAGVALLVGGLVLAYQKVEPFRDIVDTGMGVAKDAIDAVWGAISTMVDWVGKGTNGWDDIRRVADAALSPVQSAVGAVSDALETAIGWVQNLIGWLDKIDVPDIDIPFVGRNASDPFTGGKPTAGTGDTGQTTIVVQVAPQDQDRAISDLLASLTEYMARRGQVLSLVEAPTL